MIEALQVVTTVDDRERARVIANRLVEDRLAACVQVVGPIESVYRWEGRVETAAEWLCLIKTTTDRYDDLERAIRAIHPYHEPEILAFPVIRGSPGYLAWLEAAC
ncbi:MAG: divalent-cation tolerance protein CutA [Gemmatimonadetes bacterium]|nr:divalent-cation tolerance protein CutA [Gemmatimonadota bacterium]